MSVILEKISQEQLKTEGVPDFRVGDTVTVNVRIREGDKERVQAYTGTVIARDGHGATETFTVRRVSFGEGVERVFPLHSPMIQSMALDRRGLVRRAKLYYLRTLSGKRSRIKERRV
ncbi:MAG: 50S ribosomal protein L19 [Candidatus Marinimicrobia bacterium]|nr:50S ribosomal protein L19 [Candidatus Neomarinimicrobiota bacterium]